MARRQGKKRGKRDKKECKKRRRPKKVYRHGLIEAIGKCFPSQFFSRWRVRLGLDWTPQRIVWIAMMMALSAEQTLQSRFEAAIDVVGSLFPRWRLGKTYTGWFQAQLQWIEPVQPALAKRLRQRIEQMAGQHWLREGWCAFAADGSRVECPRTAANERELKCAGRDKTGPQLFVTTLLHMGTGLIWDFRIGPGTASERRHLEDMAPGLPPRSLLIADAGFTGYDFYRRIVQAKQNFLMRVGANVRLLKNLGYIEREGSDTVYLWPEANRSEPPIVLRLIQRRDGDKTMYLVTNVLDRKELSNKSVGILYEMRWGVEVFYRSFKQTMEKKKMLSHTPEAAKCELTWALYSCWMLQSISVEAILEAGGDPLRYSAARARDRVRKSMRKALLAGRGQRRRGPKNVAQDKELLWELGKSLIDNYTRTGSKKARDWPHKKKEQPPGAPKLQSATAEQQRAAKRVKQRRSAA